MEEYSLKGAPPMNDLPRPPPVRPDAAAKAAAEGALLLDLRSPEAFAGAFIPRSLAVPLEMLPAYAGYLLDCETDLLLVPESDAQVETAVRYLVRMGFDRIGGYLKGGLHAWEVSGRAYDQIGAVHAADLDDRLKRDGSFTLLDVRKVAEFRERRLAGAVHIFLGELPDRVDEIDKDKTVVTFCGSGRRAIIAASILKRHGFDKVEDSLGSMKACESVGCTVEEG